MSKFDSGLGTRALDPMWSRFLYKASEVSVTSLGTWGGRVYFFYKAVSCKDSTQTMFD